MSPTHCIHKTLDRAQDGLHYCIDCRRAFTINEWDYKQQTQRPEPKLEAQIPISKVESSERDSTVPVWVARMYRWLMVVGVLLILGIGFMFFCNKTSEGPEQIAKAPAVVETPMPAQEACQNNAPETKPEPVCPQNNHLLEQKLAEAIKNNEKIKKIAPPVICEPKIVYVPSPNKCECTEAIKAACGKTREAVKSILRHNWKDHSVRDSQSKHYKPEGRIKSSEEEYSETEDLLKDPDMEIYKEDSDSDGNGWFK